LKMWVRSKSNAAQPVSVVRWLRKQFVRPSRSHG
jgi:hypothetical protein